jgi:hypothetical protein
MTAEQARFDNIMQSTMRNRSHVALAHRSVGLDGTGVRPEIPRLNGLSELAERHARKAGMQVRWQDTPIQVIDNGIDPWQMVADAVRQKSAATRNEYEVTEQDPEDEDRERSETEVDADPEIQALKDEINRVMGRGSVRKPSASDRRSSAMDAGKCTECRFQSLTPMERWERNLRKAEWMRTHTEPFPG